MTEESMLEPPAPEKVAEPSVEINEVVIRSYPKTILLYPMALVSLIAAVILFFNLLFYSIVNPMLYQQILSTVAFVWMLVFFFNLLLVTFDFGKTVVIGLIFLLIIIILGIAVIFLLYGFIPWINPAILNLQINLLQGDSKRNHLQKGHSW